MAPHAVSQTPPPCDPAVTAPSVDRRGCVRLLVGLLGALSLQRASAVRDGLGSTADLQTWLQQFGPDRLGDAAALSRLGAGYLASYPDEQEPRRLARLILRDSTAPAKSALIGSICQDWSRHDVALVEGWVLSRTEARICAVLHLMGGTPG